MPEPKHVVHNPKGRHAKELTHSDAAVRQWAIDNRFNRQMAGMTKRQRARRERLLQAELYNARVTVLARMMVNWFIAFDKQDSEERTKRLEFLQAEIAKLLKMFTWQVVEKIKASAEEAYEAYVLDEQNKRIMAEFKPIEVREGPAPAPYTQEELDEFAAAGE